MRDNLKSENKDHLIYKAIGNLMLISIFVALFALISNFAAWMIIQSAASRIVALSLAQRLDYLQPICQGKRWDAIDF
jgi:uncharacterized membrane protein HdeD (DUF308 family)